MVLALADDLTGAIEVGAQFAAAGLRALVTTRHTWDGEEPVRVIDTETRHRGAEEAAGVVGRLAAEAWRRGARLIYKKTDSTLRGNIAAELEAVARACGDSRLVYVPAYPAMGRTVKNGHLLVDGVPVELTEFARDPLNPVGSGDVAGWFGDAGLVEVVDAETDEKVGEVADRLVRAEGTVVAAGTGALARALARRMGAIGEQPRFPAVRRCLVVNGSLHPASARQMAAFAWDGEWVAFDGRAVEGMRGAVAGFDALAVFGGDTALAVLGALGCEEVRPYGEIVPGAPVSRIRVEGREITLITKAGGFGAVDILATIRRLLAGKDE